MTLTVTGVRGASNGALYAYLEDVKPDGRVIYVTEGELALAERAIAPRRDNPAWRKLRTSRTYDQTDASPFPLRQPQQVTFDLLPTSVLFQPQRHPDHDRGRRPRRVPAAARRRQSHLQNQPQCGEPFVRGTARDQVSAAEPLRTSHNERAGAKSFLPRTHADRGGQIQDDREFLMPTLQSG